MNLDSITESFNADAFLRIDFVGQTVWSGSQVTRQKDFNSSLFDLKGNKKRVWRSYFHLTTKADMFYNNNRLDAADLTDLLFNQLKKDRIIN
ncbi:hypothetical protein K1X84_02540 [bacterium]|nr:hypothetical protein [bacterium]